MNEPIGPERWEEVERLLDDVLDLDAKEQEARLAAADVDEDVRGEVEALLVADAHAPGFLDADAADFAVPLLPDPPDVSPASDGERVGPYRLVRAIGRGGMSAVYLAERADGQFERQVALKVIRRDVRRDELVQRFRAERQILASLDHLNVARVYGGGLTDDGLPYLVMEYVHGTPLDVYCDERQLTVDERLNLFVDVCSAVQHAHRNLVVHRDLKPSNVLVTDDGTVKLLDFGIAKLLDEEASHTVPVTLTGQRWMTPAYAAPEQIRGETVTTATDVYGLGVLLYELLAGRRPFDDAGTAPHQVAAAVLDTEPPRPSTAAVRTPSSSDDEAVTPEEVASARRVPPKRLRRLLAGDLDAVVLKALRKEPEARYASAEALADDLHAYLENRPVAARRGAWSYRARKYARRHRGRVLVAALALLVLAGGPLWHAGRVAEERDRAREEAARAEAVQSFLTELFEEAGAYADGDPALTTAAELLELGTEQARRTGGEEGTSPRVRADMLTALARAHSSLFQGEEAAALSREAMALYREVPGDERGRVRAMNTFGAALATLGKQDSAVVVTRDALALARRLKPADHEVQVDALNRLGVLIRDQAPDSARTLYREALTLAREHLPEEHAGRLSALNNLANYYSEQGRPEEAARWHRAVLRIRERNLAPGHPHLTVTRINFAATLQRLDHLDEADSLLRLALSSQIDRLGESHPSVTFTRNVQAAVRRKQGDLDGAAELYRQILEHGPERLPADHMVIAFAEMGLGRVLTEWGRPGEAAAYLQRSIDKLPDGHWYEALSLSALGEARAAQGRAERAEELLLQGYETVREARGPDDEYTRRTLDALVGFYEQTGRKDDADRYRARLTGDA